MSLVDDAIELFGEQQNMTDEEWEFYRNVNKSGSQKVNINIFDVLKGRYRNYRYIADKKKKKLRKKR